jgi:hypothetical protein
LIWPGNGLLLQATNLSGLWTTNQGAASPFITNAHWDFKILPNQSAVRQGTTTPKFRKDRVLK